MRRMLDVALFFVICYIYNTRFCTIIETEEYKEEEGRAAGPVQGMQGGQRGCGGGGLAVPRTRGHRHRGGELGARGVPAAQ